MWAVSLTRIGLATGLAVAGGLSLAGVVASLPGKDVPELSRHGSVASSSSAALRVAGLGDGQGAPPFAPRSDGWPKPLGTGEQVSPTRAPIDSGQSSQLAQPVLMENLDRQAGDLGAIAPAAGVPAAVPVTLPLADEAQTAEPAANSDPGYGPFLASALIEPTAAPGTTDADRPSPPQTESAASAVDSTAASASSIEPGSPVGYIVIGSFRSETSAARHVSDFARWQPAVQVKESAGQTQYRVLVGPFTPADLPQALQHITQGGVPDAWQVTLPQPVGSDSPSLRRLDSFG